MSTAAARKLDGKYLTFVLGEEEYGIDALRVQGILTMLPITPIPNAPYYFRGVATIRGRVAPIISARARLGMGEIEESPETCVILVALAGNAWAGMIVDTVRDVIDIGLADIEEPPVLGGTRSEVIGLAKCGDKVKILLDIEATFGEVGAYVEERSRPLKSPRNHPDHFASPASAGGFPFEGAARLG